MTRLPSLGPRGEGWVALQLVLLALVALAGFMGRGSPDGLPGTVLVLAGLILLASGLILSLRGLRDLGSNLTPVPHPRAGATFVGSGIYARARHPIYGGLIVGAFGWSLVLSSPPALAAAVVLALFFELKSRREEAWLVARYPEYPGYAARTSRFVPGIY
jgi:protein-S-isoprenylcysteine O-methyltransferase Ste14